RAGGEDDPLDLLRRAILQAGRRGARILGPDAVGVPEGAAARLARDRRTSISGDHQKVTRTVALEDVGRHQEMRGEPVDVSAGILALVLAMEPILRRSEETPGVSVAVKRRGQHEVPPEDGR